MSEWKAISEIVQMENKQLQEENQRLRAALEQVRLEVIRHTTKHFSDHICRIANPVLNETEHTEIPCGRCGGSGFSGYGTGYDAVCDECGGAGFALDISSTTEPAEVDRIKELWEASHLLTKQVGIIAVYRQGLVDACEALGISIQPMEENNE